MLYLLASELSNGNIFLKEEEDVRGEEETKN